MLLKEFYINVVSSESMCVNFLQTNAILGHADNYDPYRKCGTEMRQKRRKTLAGEWVLLLPCTKRRRVQYEMVSSST